MLLTGGQIVVEILIREGVPYIVGIPGHGTLGLSDALIAQEQLQVLQVGHEQAAVQYAIPAVYVVANNVGWIAIRDLQAAVYGEERAIGAEFLKDKAPISPDLTALAKAFGCHAERISAPEEVKPAVERAFAVKAPAVIEVMVERNYPLSGSPAIGWWDVPVPTYLGEQRARYDREQAEEQ